MEQGPPRSGWRSGIPHHQQGIVGNAAMEHQEERGLFLLVFQNCLNSSGFHMLAQTRPDKPAVEFFQWKDKCHQGIGPLQLIPKAWERLCISQET